MIIHYVGDIHQPLHVTAEVDSNYPTGDEGGNKEYIPSQDGVSNMHYVWDSIIYQYTGYPDLPLSDDDWDWYTTTAATLYSANPIAADASDLAVGDIMSWATKGLEISKEYVYPDFVNGEIPSDDYQERAKPVIESQMMYGARRLAEVVKEIYGDSAITEKEIPGFFADLFLH